MSHDSSVRHADYTLLDVAVGMQDLGTLGGSMSQGNAINCSGVIAGSSWLSSDVQTRAFVYVNGSMIDLGTLGGSSSQANGINDSGQVVGFANIMGDADQHAFLWTPQKGMQDLNNLIHPNSGWTCVAQTPSATTAGLLGPECTTGNCTRSF